MEPVPRLRSAFPGIPWGVCGWKMMGAAPRLFLLSRSASLQRRDRAFAQMIAEKSESAVAYRVFHRLSASKSRRMSQKDNHPLLLGKQILSVPRRLCPPSSLKIGRSDGYFLSVPGLLHALLHGE